MLNKSPERRSSSYGRSFYSDLNELIQGIVNDLKGKLEEYHQKLVASVHEDLSMISLDHG